MKTLLLAVAALGVSATGALAHGQENSRRRRLNRQPPGGRPQGAQRRSGPVGGGLVSYVF